MFSLVFIVLAIKEVRVCQDIQEGAGGLMIGVFDMLLWFSACLMLAFDATINLQCEMKSGQSVSSKPLKTYLCHFFQLFQFEMSALITLLVLQVRE
jgi:hypothetical protein